MTTDIAAQDAPERQTEDTLQLSPWAKEKRRNALTSTFQSIPAAELRDAIAIAVCRSHGRSVAISLALGFEAAIEDAIKDGYANS